MSILTKDVVKSDAGVPAPRGAITWRAVALGLLSTITICSIAYYNEYALNNCPFIGNNLPLGLTMMAFLFLVLVNGPLCRWAPRYALSTGEMVVAFSMALVSCCLPCGGLMRFLANAIITPFWQAQSNKEYQDLLLSLKLPNWLFPKFPSEDRSTWFNSPLVNGYMMRWSGTTPPPYAAWIGPALIWGVPTFALYGGILCLMTIVRRQWMENERLPFPLAQIQMALIEAPKPGQWFNAQMRSRVFWIGFAMVFFIHMWNGGAAYFPRLFPVIPIRYVMYRLFADPPFSFMEGAIKDATIYFTVVGVAYFLNSSISFSIWATFVLLQIYHMICGTLTGDGGAAGIGDQRFGSIVAFTLAIVWIGRAHWMLVLKQAFRGEKDGEPRGVFLSYRMAFWGLVFCSAVMAGWLVAAGCNLPAAICLVVFLLTLFVVTARIVAETGLVHSPFLVPLHRPLDFMAIAGISARPSVESYYLTGAFDACHYDFRETLSVYSSHAMRLADGTVVDSGKPNPRSTGRKFIALLFLALVVGYGFSWAGTLGTQYNTGTTLDSTQTFPVNWWGVFKCRETILDKTISYQNNSYNTPFSPGANFALGFGLTAFMSYMRLHFVWWPLHPVGYILLATFPGVVLWFSFFLGWLAKQLIVKFGGTRLYAGAKPFFLGMIVGESIAGGVWLVLTLALSAAGHSYVPIKVMPW